jgi:gluconokinase
VAPIVVMGVSGVGKTTVGGALARRLGRPFLDADDFHSAEGVRKMSAGEPLTDGDREPWLERMAKALCDEAARGRAPVLACSALSERARAVLRAASPALVFVFLSADRAVVEARLRARTGHFMPPSLLDSQLDALEEPRDSVRVDAAEAVTAIVERIVGALGKVG